MDDMVHEIHDRLGSAARFALRLCSKRLRATLCARHAQRPCPISTKKLQPLVEELARYGSPELVRLIASTRWESDITALMDNLFPMAVRHGNEAIVSMFRYNDENEEIHLADLTHKGSDHSLYVTSVEWKALSFELGQLGSESMFELAKPWWTELAHDSFSRGLAKGDHLELLIQGKEDLYESLLPRLSPSIPTRRRLRNVFIDDAVLVTLLGNQARRCLAYVKPYVQPAQWSLAWANVLNQQKYMTKELIEHYGELWESPDSIFTPPLINLVFAFARKLIADSTPSDAKATAMIDAVFELHALDQKGELIGIHWNVDNGFYFLRLACHTNVALKEKLALFIGKVFPLAKIQDLLVLLTRDDSFDKTSVPTLLSCYRDKTDKSTLLKCIQAVLQPHAGHNYVYPYSSRLVDTVAKWIIEHPVDTAGLTVHPLQCHRHMNGPSFLAHLYDRRLVASDRQHYYIAYLLCQVYSRVYDEDVVTNLALIENQVGRLSQDEMVLVLLDCLRMGASYNNIFTEPLSFWTLRVISWCERRIGYRSLGAGTTAPERSLTENMLYFFTFNNMFPKTSHVWTWLVHTILPVDEILFWRYFLCIRAYPLQNDPPNDPAQMPMVSTHVITHWRETLFLRHVLPQHLFKAILNKGETGPLFDHWVETLRSDHDLVAFGITPTSPLPESFVPRLFVYCKEQSMVKSDVTRVLTNLARLFPSVMDDDANCRLVARYMLNLA